MVTEAEAAAVINPERILIEAILAEQERDNLSESRIAERYGLNRMTIRRWKAGEVSKSHRALITLLENNRSSP